MKMKFATMTVRQILELREQKMLTVNAEYQRGAVWTSAQQKRLIDSLMRDYPLPLIYLHHLKRQVADMQREDLEIIDGQQRIDALYMFSQNRIKLFDPTLDEKDARFPQFIKRTPCPWGRKDYDSLPDAYREKFDNTPLFVAKITTDDEHEARDLFIRLQAGLPLNAQEKRDAWPGGFTEFVLKYGGKPEITRYPGHDFFKNVVAVGGRGKSRHLCAQMAMVFMAHHESGQWPDISTRALDDFYYRHLDFDLKSQIALRFEEVLDLLVELVGDGKRPNLKGHEALHLMLIVDALKDDYVPSWKAKLAPAFDLFKQRVASDKSTRRSESPGEYWINYDARTRTDSDRGETIRVRHQFFAEKMLEFMAPLQAKDQNRGFGAVERELIYYRDAKKCAVCDVEIPWDDVEIHHVDPHAHGGPTAMDNAVPVHSNCHPKGRHADDFRAQYQAKKAALDAASDRG